MMKRSTIFAILALCGLSAHVQAAITYTVTEVGVAMRGESLNDLGQVAGYTLFSDSPQPVLYTSGRGIEFIGGPQSKGYAWSVNNRGQVTGEGGSAATRTGAYLYTPGSGVTRLIPPDRYSAGYGLNESGEVVGSVRVGDYNQAFVYTPGKGVQDIDAGQGRHSYAHAINETGQVVGAADDINGVPHAFVYTAEAGMVDISAGAAYSVMWDINNRGVAVGDFGADTSHIQLTLVDTASGTFTPLPFSAEWGDFKQARSINDAGQVVGSADYRVDGNVQLRAFLFDPEENRVLDLNTLVDPALGVTFGDAMAINNKGQILVSGNSANAYVLTPIPEPNQALLLAVGLVGVGWRLVPKVRYAARLI